jgi:hypothetical protein
MTANELRAISRKLSTYLELHPDDKDARSLADRCGEIAALLEATSAYQRLRPRNLRSWSLEDRVLRIASGAPLTRREIRLAGMFALVWFAMLRPWIAMVAAYALALQVLLTGVAAGLLQRALQLLGLALELRFFVAGVGAPPADSIRIPRCAK